MECSPAPEPPLFGPNDNRKAGREKCSTRPGFLGRRRRRPSSNGLVFICREHATNTYVVAMCQLAQPRQLIVYTVATAAGFKPLEEGRMGAGKRLHSVFGRSGPLCVPLVAGNRQQSTPHRIELCVTYIYGTHTGLSVYLYYQLVEVMGKRSVAGYLEQTP